MPFSNQLCQFFGRSLLLLILCPSTALFSQKEIPSVNSESFELPLKTTAGFGLSGFKLTAENPVEQVLIDSVHGIAYVVVNKGASENRKGKGYLIAHDFGKNKSIWSMPVDLNSGRFFLADSLLIYDDSNWATALNFKDGSILWKNTENFHTLVPKGDFAITSFSKSGGDIRKVNVRTGLVEWKYNTGIIGDFQKATFVGDSVLLISAKGLYYVSIYGENRWYLPAKTGVATTGTGGGMVAAGILGGLVGMAIYAAATGGLTTSTGSKQDHYLLFRNDLYLIATDKFYRINPTGSVQFEMDNPYKSVSVPKLFTHKGSVYAVSTGKGLNPDGTAVYSTAFIAKHRAGSFTWDKIRNISTQKREYINDYLLGDSSITFACNNRMVEIGLSDLEIIQEKTFGTQLTDIGLKDIVSPPGFIPTETDYLKTTEAMPGHIFIENSAKMKIEFDKDLAMAAVIPKKNYFSIIAEHNGMRIIGNGSEIDFIDDQNQSIFDYTFSDRAQFYGNMIMDIQENEVIWIALKTVE